jgi:serine phosphatase RsbU (regulator of sigma subunit)
VTVASAGHPDPILRIEGSAASVELPRNPPLGVVEEYEFEAGACALSAEGALVLFSDGLIEAGSRPDMFGVDRVLRQLESDTRRGAGVSRALLESAVAYAGGAIDDDVAVMVLRFAP